MSSRPPRPRDTNQLAKAVVDLATGDPAARHIAEFGDQRNPAAVALGRLGGLKGGQARASSMTAERRKEIAQLAAAKRWGKRDD